jgi:hypothetical protein
LQKGLYLNEVFAMLATSFPRRRSLHELVEKNVLPHVISLQKEQKEFTGFRDKECFAPRQILAEIIKLSHIITQFTTLKSFGDYHIIRSQYLINT